MRTSQCLLSTLREIPSDTDIISHRLMVKAGLIRKVAAGIYNWLPVGVRVLNKFKHVVREEMDRSGAQEVLLPSIQPEELWKESGRLNQYGLELIRLKDRHDHGFCLGPTHEEVITTLMKKEIRSYRQLPVNFYQIQTKFRDEMRPRFGIIRSREFIMKDAYSFHIDQNSLQETYNLMYRTYCTIFDRIRLKYRVVVANNGTIGGHSSHEFHVLSESGEDKIAFSDSSNYASNVELTEAIPPKKKRSQPKKTMKLVDTPDMKTIQCLVDKFSIPIEKIIQTIVVEADPKSKYKLVALLIRGDQQLSVAKSEKLKLVATPLKLAEESFLRSTIGTGIPFIGPLNLSIPVIVDRTVAETSDFCAGANIDNKYYFGINWDRDLPLSEVADIRNVVEGDPSPDGKGKLTISRGIEVGHIFQIGTKYSQSIKSSVLDKDGKLVNMKMGCYGIGISRVIAAAIEQNHDEKGIIWPNTISPYDIVIIPIGFFQSNKVKKTAICIHDQLESVGFDVLLDDRNENTGVMFSDMELIGIPYQLIIGKRNLQKGVIECYYRAKGVSKQIKIDLLLDFLFELFPRYKTNIKKKDLLYN